MCWEMMEEKRWRECMNGAYFCGVKICNVIKRSRQIQKKILWFSFPHICYSCDWFIFISSSSFWLWRWLWRWLTSIIIFILTFTHSSVFWWIVIFWKKNSCVKSSNFQRILPILHKTCHLIHRSIDKSFCRIDWRGNLIPNHSCIWNGKNFWNLDWNRWRNIPTELTTTKSNNQTNGSKRKRSQQLTFEKSHQLTEPDPIEQRLTFFVDNGIKLSWTQCMTPTIMS